MGHFDPLMAAARRSIDNATALLESQNPPFNVMYRQYKTVQSLWFRVIEDASDSNSQRLEDLCVELESVSLRLEQWIKENSPSKPSKTAKPEQ